MNEEQGRGRNTWAEGAKLICLSMNSNSDEFREMQAE
jgi:hypothetical protein